MCGSGGEALAVGGGAEAVVGFEAAGEAALVGPADRAPDAGDRLVGVQEQDGGVLGAELAQVGHGRKDGGRLIVSTPRPGGEYGPAHSRNPSSGSSRVQASSRRSSSLLKQQLYTSNRRQSWYPCQTPGRSTRTSPGRISRRPAWEWWVAAPPTAKAISTKLCVCTGLSHLCR